MKRTTTITDCTIANNSAGDGGGVASAVNSSLTINNCTVRDNQATRGGGIVSNGTLTLTASTVSGNRAAEEAAGIVIGGSVEMTNCTISGNVATGANSAGGIMNSSGSGVFITMSHCTLTGNQGGSTGGIRFFNAGFAATFNNNIIAGNQGGDFDEYSSFGGSVAILTSAGNVLGHSGQTFQNDFLFYNKTGSDFDATDSGTPTALSAILNTTLANNGGGTQTHLLVASSPAIEHVADCPLAVDQRAVARSLGSACSAGSVEGVLIPTAVTGRQASATSNTPPWGVLLVALCLAFATSKAGWLNTTPDKTYER